MQMYPDAHPARIGRRPQLGTARAAIAVLLLLIAPVVLAATPAWEADWAQIQCPRVSYRLQVGDLAGAELQAKRGRLDCMVLVAEAHRGRGDLGAARAVLADVIGFAEDPQRATYPLLLFYKVAYLGGTKADYGKLHRHDPELAAEARRVLLAERSAALIAYLRDPRGQPCPNTEAPFDDDPLLNTADAVCASEQARAAAAAAGPMRLAELPQLLASLEQHYPIDAAGQTIPAPDWIAREQTWAGLALGCISGYDTHVGAYEAARFEQGTLEQQRESLLAARDAVRPCADRLAEIGIDGWRLTDALAAVEDQIRERQARQSAQQRLEEDIRRAMASPQLPTYAQFSTWQEQLRQMPSIVLPEPYENTLRALKNYFNCTYNAERLAADPERFASCRQVGFSARERDGRLTVSVDQTAARRFITGYLAYAAAPGASGTAAACDLYKTFSGLAQKASKFKRRPPADFAAEVQQTLSRCGASPACISDATLAAVQAHKAWVWTAFADCRLDEGRHSDALDNLDVAARHVRPDTDIELADLLVSRLLAVADDARDAGVQGFRADQLPAKLGKKSRSIWLREAVAAGPPTPAPRALTDTAPAPDDSLPQSAAASAPAATPAALHADAASGAGWYARHRDEAMTVAYFTALRADAPDIGTAMTRVEQARPELLDLMRYWDQVELDSPSAIGTEPVKRIVGRLRAAAPERLEHVAMETTASKERDDLRQTLGFYPADLAVRHAIARRAIELDCPRIAEAQLAPVGADHLAAVGEATATLHRLVLDYVTARLGAADPCTAP
jgi:hypothetical protein